MQLTDQQVREFFDVGYIVLKKLFSKAEIQMVGQCLDRIYTESKTLPKKTQIHKGTQFVFEGPSLHRVVWAGAIESYLLEIGEDARLIGPAAQLLGSDEMDQIINQIHFKIPGDNVGFPWHQDSENRGYGTPDWTDVNGRGSYVQTAIAIDHQKIENGTMYFIPRSCHKGHIGLEKIEDKESVLPMDQIVPLIMEPGDAAIFGPYTVHGSYPNEGNQERRLFINGYCYPGANHKAYPGEGSGRRIRHKTEKKTFVDLIATGAEI